MGKNQAYRQLHEHIPNLKAKETYSQIRKKGIISKIELAEKTKIKISTLTRILDELTEQGLILEAGFGESTGGRRPILYRINPTYAYVLGFDLSRTYSKIVLFDLGMNPVDSVRWIMTNAMTPDYLLEQVTQATQNLMKIHNISPRSLLGMGIGAVGPLDHDNGVILDPIHYPAPGWKNVSISQFLEEQLHIPVLLDNGANTAAMGEYWTEDHNQYQHLAYIHAGIGLRSGMISNGKVVYGATDMEGAIGHMIIQADGTPFCDQCRNYGCLESYTTIHALTQQTISHLKQGRKSIVRELSPNLDQITFPHLIQALQQNDPLVNEVFTQGATYFGIGLANLLNILHPEKVILGGPLITQADLFYHVSTEVALEKTNYYPTYTAQFSRGNLGEDALATGAAVMVVERLDE